MEAVDRAVVGGVGAVRLARARAGMDQVVVLEDQVVVVVSEVATAAVAGEEMTAAVAGAIVQRARWARASGSSPS